MTNKLQKEFVPYELAVKLKELGFDEPCIIIYYDNGKHFVISETLMTNSKAEKLSSTSDIEITSPLYQQAFRWFREKFGLFGCIDLQVCNPSHWFIRIDKIDINDYLYHSEDENIQYSTYEEAELACLIKLIEIVKEKQ